MLCQNMIGLWNSCADCSGQPGPPGLPNYLVNTRKYGCCFHCRCTICTKAVSSGIRVEWCKHRRQSHQHVWAWVECICASIVRVYIYPRLCLCTIQHLCAHILMLRCVMLCYVVSRYAMSAVLGYVTSSCVLFCYDRYIILYCSCYACYIFEIIFVMYIT